MNMTKRTVDGITHFTSHRGDLIATVHSGPHGLYDVIPGPRLASDMNAIARVCCGLNAAELFVKVLASEWDYFR